MADSNIWFIFVLQDFRATAAWFYDNALLPNYSNSVSCTYVSRKLPGY